MREERTGDDGRTALARRLKEARFRLRLSMRELSRVTRISCKTISALESGRDARWSTLIRYLEAVPGLRAADLVPGPVAHPPAASSSLFRFMRRACGEGAARVVVLRRGPRDGTVLTQRTIHGLVTEVQAATPEDTALRLMQVACAGSREVTRSLAVPARGRSVVRAAEHGMEHVFRVSTEDGVRVAYRCTQSQAEAVAPCLLEHEAAFAADSLTLAAEIPQGRTARLLVWPIGRREEGRSAEIAAQLYPAGRRPRLRRRGSVLVVTIPEVIPGLVHVLSWDEAEARDATGLELETPSGEEGFGPIARSLRARSGRSVRALAEAMGVSHVTVAEAERGRDPRASTLRSYLRALPDVPPQWLLPAREAPGDLTVEEAWSAVRDLHGVMADEHEAVQLLDEQGRSTTTESLRGLRTLDGSRRTVAVTRFAGKSIHSRGRHVVEVIESGVADGEEDVRSRMDHSKPGRPVQSLVIPPDLASRGVTLSVRTTSSHQTVLTRDDVHRRYGPTDELVASGMGLTICVPATRLRCTLLLPRRCRPLRVWPVALSYDRAWDEAPLGVLDLAHPGRWTFRSDAATGEHVLEVELPFHGFKYGIGFLI